MDTISANDVHPRNLAIRSIVFESTPTPDVVLALGGGELRLCFSIVHNFLHDVHDSHVYEFLVDIGGGVAHDIVPHDIL